MRNTFPNLKNKAEIKKQLRSEWAAWRLVLSGYFSYEEVFYYFTPYMIEKANIALDMKIEAEEKAMKKKR